MICSNRLVELSFLEKGAGVISVKESGFSNSREAIIFFQLFSLFYLFSGQSYSFIQFYHVFSFIRLNQNNFLFFILLKIFLHFLSDL